MKELTPPIRKDRIPLQDILPLKQPLRVNIDPCDLCNFKCDFCFQSQKNNFVGGIMSIELFDEVVSQLKSFDEPINVVHLYGLGEPFINKNIPYYIKKLKKENVAKEVKTTSNGSLLTQNIIDEVVSAGLDEITISLNGLKDNDFERIVNTKVDFNKLYSNVKYLYEHRNNCHVHIKIIGDYFSVNEQERFIDLIGPYADSINIDGVTNHWSGLETTEKQQQQYNVGGNVFMDWPICALCFYELAIHSDGSVSPCSVDWRKDESNLGNIKEQSLIEIWNSEKRNNIITDFLEGKTNSYLACRECEYPLAGAGVNLEPYKEDLLRRYVRNGC